jgi:oligopeptide transport system substrate-binding protein
VQFAASKSIHETSLKEENQMRSKLFKLFVLVIAASMVLSACATATNEPATIVETVIVEGTPQTVVVTATPAAEAAVAPVLRVNLGTYPDIIDPQKSSFVNEIAHLEMMYEGLTRLNDKLETVPGAAESWTYNDDATELTFQLRSGLMYSDGTLLNAKRFEYSLLRNIDPATAGEYSSITDEIMGAPEWRSADLSTATDDELAALKAAVGVIALDSAGNACVDYEQTDCLTLKLTLSKPAPYFHTVMSLWVTFPAKEENISEGGEQWWNSSKYQVGNGPFILQSLEPFVRGYFVPNPNYWGDKPSYDLEYRYITDSAVAFEAYKNDEFDIITLSAEDLKTVQADETLSQQAMIYPGSCTYNLNFHQLKEPFTDKAVREAFSYALDREAWVEDVLKGLGAPTLTWIPKGFPGYDETEDRFQYDPEKAKQVLADNGYTVENGVLTKDGTAYPITLTFSDTPRNRTRFEWIASKWKEDLDLDVTLDPVESTTYTALTKDVATAPQLFILGWCADYPDPQNWLSVYWKSTSGFAGRIAYVNPAFDELVNAADIELDAATRAELYMEAQDELVTSIPGVFFWNNVNSYLVKPWVKGISQTPQDSGFAGEKAPTTITIDTSMLP